MKIKKLHFYIIIRPGYALRYIDTISKTYEDFHRDDLDGYLEDALDEDSDCIATLLDTPELKSLLSGETLKYNAIEFVEEQNGEITYGPVMVTDDDSDNSGLVDSMITEVDYEREVRAEMAALVEENAKMTTSRFSCYKGIKD